MHHGVRSRLLLALVGLAIALMPAPVFGWDSPGLRDYVFIQAKHQSYDLGQSMYGCYGQAYCYGWPAYRLIWEDNTFQPLKNVAAIYMRSGNKLVEIGYENDFDSWWHQGKIDSRPSWIFVAIENGGYQPYAKWEGYARGIPGTWVTFEINNHAMTSSTGKWYAAWNGNTILHGWSAAAFSAAAPQAAAERSPHVYINQPPYWPDTWTDMRAKFRYLQYKRPQGNWAPWNYAYVIDSDDYWNAARKSGYTNYYYMYQSNDYPGQ